MQAAKQELEGGHVSNPDGVGKKANQSLDDYFVLTAHNLLPAGPEPAPTQRTPHTPCTLPRCTADLMLAYM